MKLFNSLTNQVEEVETSSEELGIYTCGPTVYDYVTIGNWRTYTLGDLLVRALRVKGSKVRYVMNITDVGHLTGDNHGDADTGEDRLEKASKKEGKSAWDIAEFYAQDFLEGYKKLNLSEPEVFCKATDHIPEQIAMVEKIEKNGFAYKIDDGVYFDVAAYEAAGNEYGQLSTLDKIEEGARVAVNAQKRSPRDFALWKFCAADEERHMQWDSPWGMGFPGWHIECSAMSEKYLGEQFDIHVGGEDLRSTHHPNEIAQSEAASGKKPFVKYWLHGAFLQVDGGRMGKSLGNAYMIQDVEARGFSPLSLRYFYLTGHYRKALNFTWKALGAADTALHKLWAASMVFSQFSPRSESSPEVRVLVEEFVAQAGEDLNFPKALAGVWTGLKKLQDQDRADYLFAVDSVLGLDLQKHGMRLAEENTQGQKLFGGLLSQREILRGEKKYAEADKVRDLIADKGYLLEDSSEGVFLRKKG